jgi:hypothetical protein
MMRLNQQLRLRHVGSSYFIVDPGCENIDLSYILTLNRPAAFLWETFLQREFTVEMMAESLCRHFEVEQATALQDVKNMLEQWKEYGMMA